jgi:ligand-binding SRPBCC domain-containing protein
MLVPGLAAFSRNGEEVMPVIRLETRIQAPIERCFDLSLSVDVHCLCATGAHERPVAGVMTGMMKLEDTVTWEAIHFGVRQQLTSKITAYERPHRFTDEMVRGAFQAIKHTHDFVPTDDGTLLIDTFLFRAPLGPLGRLAEALVLTRYMKGLLLARNRCLKQVAETETHHLPPTHTG